jgi:alpha-amylase
MASTCFCFHVHQPDRLRRFTIFDTGNDYFDGLQNAEICRQVSRRCYLPTNRLLREMIEHYRGLFKVSFSITGVLLEQLHDHAPEVLESFQALADTGCVEFLAQTYYNSLSFLFSPAEFAEQVMAHRALIQRLFGQTPRVFHNAERIYNNSLAEAVEQIGDFDAILVGGAATVLCDRSCHHLYRPPNPARVKLLLRNTQLSDDIAFRFSNRHWNQWPLVPHKFAEWIHAAHGNGPVINLCLDYETFGEHLPQDSGIFDFVRMLPGEILKHPASDVKTPGEAAAFYEALDVLDVPAPRPQVTTPQELPRWIGNAIQQDAVAELYRLEQAVKAAGDSDMLRSWRKLQTCDHLSYMDVRLLDPPDAQQYASPYESPYDSYINFMNVLEHLKLRCTDYLSAQHAQSSPMKAQTGARSGSHMSQLDRPL